MSTTIAVVSIEHEQGQDVLAALTQQLGTQATISTTVTILTVTHKYGQDNWPCVSIERAKDVLFDYVEQWWENEFDEEDKPTDRDAAIKMYFYEVADREYYSIEELPIS